MWPGVIVRATRLEEKLYSATKNDYRMGCPAPEGDLLPLGWTVLFRSTMPEILISIMDTVRIEVGEYSMLVVGDLIR